MEKLNPLGDKVILKPIVAEGVTRGGLFIPDTAKEKPQEGDIIAIGPGKVDKAGNKIPMDVKVGDRVIYGKYTGSEIKIDDEKYLIMSESDIMAVKGAVAKRQGKVKKDA